MAYKKTTYGTQDAPEPHNGVYFAISISICAISTVMIKKNPEISTTASTFVFAFNRRSVLFVYFPPQTSARTQSPNEVLPPWLFILREHIRGSVRLSDH